MFQKNHEAPPTIVVSRNIPLSRGICFKKTESAGEDGKNGIDNRRQDPENMVINKRRKNDAKLLKRGLQAIHRGRQEKNTTPLSHQAAEWEEIKNAEADIRVNDEQ